MTEQIELRKCKICGGNAHSESGADEENEWYWFSCAGTSEEEGCDYNSRSYCDYDRAVTDWNTRPLEDALQAKLDITQVALKTIKLILNSDDTCYDTLVDISAVISCLKLEATDGA